jgi:7,8-dihydropterin-6-yl-methyl-4-(beta-D-ribofuranosyl)aminobenzene 5'-phosphate synthase
MLDTRSGFIVVTQENHRYGFIQHKCSPFSFSGCIMKLTVLVDNNTLIDKYLQAEPGVSYLIEIDGKKILFDTGYSSIFIANATKMGISLLDIDFVVLSHAHLDHTWGLQHLIQHYADARFENIPFKRPTLIAHPLIFTPRALQGLGQIGCLISREIAENHFNVLLTREPFQIHPKLTFLGEIERVTAFESQVPIGKIQVQGSEQDDFVMDDSALVFQSAEGLVIITGCAHAGICNTVEYARKVSSENRIFDIIGGFHLLDPPEPQLKGTVAYFKKQHPRAVHACHCTGLESKLALSQVVKIEEVGSGLTLNFPD